MDNTFVSHDLNLTSQVWRVMLTYMPDARILQMGLVCRHWYDVLVPTYYTSMRNADDVIVREPRGSQLSTLDTYILVGSRSPDNIPYIHRVLLHKYVPKHGYHIKPFPQFHDIDYFTPDQKKLAEAWCSLMRSVEQRVFEWKYGSIDTVANKPILHCQCG